MESCEMASKVLLTTGFVVLFLVWCVAGFLGVLGLAVGLSATLRNTYYAALALYPIVGFFGLYYLWVKPSESLIKLPFFVFVALIAIAACAGWIEDFRTSRLLLREDRQQRDILIDGYVSLHLPLSFEIDSKNFQPHKLEAFYGLEPSELNAESFRYTFVRGAFTNAGGNTERPVLLILLVHDEKKLVAAHEPLVDSQYDRISEYKEPKGGFDLYLYSRQGKLDQKSCQEFLTTLGPQIHIQKPWKQRLKEIEHDFYQKYPEKRPPAK